MKIIKKEIVIEASTAKVWEHITDPRKLAGWLMPNDFEAEVGRKFFLECSHQGKIFCVVKEMVLNEKLVYSFDSKAIGVETLVTITLAKAGKGTKLTLIHSGWDALPPAKQGIADNYDGGWGTLLGQLQQEIETSAVN